MKSKTFIECLFFIALISATVNLNGQGQYSLCANKKDVKYMVTGSPGSIYYWTVDGGKIISDPQAETITINWGSTPGAYDILVFEETAKGCLGNNKRIQINIKASPVVNLGKIKTICEGEQIEFNPGGNHLTYLWQDGSSQPTYIASENGVYWVEVTNQEGCTIRDSVILIKSPLPNIKLGKDTILCEPNYLELDAGNFNGFYIWNDGSNSQTIIAREGDGQIWVKVTDSIGCIGADTIQILSCFNRFDLTIPNAFTPNGDGYNDKWEIIGFENYPNITVKIYNQWGVELFRSEKGYSEPWDGTSKGNKLPVNAYYYVIDLGNNTKEIVGSITLVR